MRLGLLSLDCYVTMNVNVCCQPGDHEHVYAEVAQAHIHNMILLSSLI